MSYSSVIGSKLPKRPIQSPVFHTAWAGISKGAVIGTFDGALNRGYRYYLTGVDTVTARDIVASLVDRFGENATISIYRLPDVGVADEAALDAIFKSEFRTTVDQNTNARDLYYEITLRSTSPQVNLVIDRPNAGVGLPPATNIKPIYVRARIYLDDDIATKLSLGQYVELFFMKSGGYNGFYYGGFRIALEILKGNNGLYWHCAADNNGNGVGVIPGYPSIVTYQTDHTTLLTPSAFAGWNTLEFYYNPPANPSDRNTGRFWARVQPDGKPRLQIADFVGGILTDQEGLPINRFGFNLYSPVATPPLFLRFGQIEMWDHVPAGLQ